MGWPFLFAVLQGPDAKIKAAEELPASGNPRWLI